MAAAARLDGPARAARSRAEAARAAGFEWVGIAAVLITVSAIVGLRGAVRYSVAGSDHPARTFLSTAAWAGRASTDTDTTQRARKLDSAHAVKRRKADTLSQDSLAKRRDALARARHKSRDSIKAHSAPPEGAVVP